MPSFSNLESRAPWRQIAATQADAGDLPAATLRTMLVSLNLIRAFEEKVLELARQGLVHGPAHSSVGQEGGAVGSILALRPTDQINGSHRGHHQFLAKGMHFLAPDGIDTIAALPSEIKDLLYRTLAEIMGLREGYCKGRGGSMHLRWQPAGALGTNAIVGGGVPFAAGAAWAHRRAGDGRVVLTYFGDGAVNIGSVLETMNLAAAWKLPLCFFIENNQYAVATTVNESTAESRLSSRGLAFGIPAWKVDGMDPLAVYLATREAARHMRDGGGPTIIEADVYRYYHQNGSLPGSAFGYRTREEEAAWRARDPLLQAQALAVARQCADAAEVASLHEQAHALMDDVAARLVEGPTGKASVRAGLWPASHTRDDGLRGDLRELQGLRYVEQQACGESMRSRKFVDAIADVLHRRMSQDQRVVILGEDIHRLKGGTNGATRGLSADFPDRCLGTPISENAFAGLAGGIAADGRYRPIVEFMYPDFMWVAADQLFNQIGKARHMFGGGNPMPLVLRTKIAIGTGYGSQHSMDPIGIFATSPGWRIVAPSTPYDYIGLMNSALQCDDPVLVVEHVDLYGRSGEIPEADLDFHIPLGKARVVRPGGCLTILAYLSMVAVAQAAAEQLGVDAEIIDLRSLDRVGLDWDTIGASVSKTHNVLVIEQGPLGTSYGTLLGDEIQRRLFDELDQPVQRVTGGEASPTISRVLERAAYAGLEEVMQGIRDAMRAQGRPLCSEAA